MSWLFFVIFAPLMAASLYFCGADSSLRNWRSSFDADLDREGQPAFSRFLRSNEAIPDPRIAAAAIYRHRGTRAPLRVGPHHQLGVGALDHRRRSHRRRLRQAP